MSTYQGEAVTLPHPYELDYTLPTESRDSTPRNGFPASPTTNRMGYTWKYYDLVLLAIAASILVGVGVGFATPLDMMAAVPLFGLVAIAIIGHALFVNGPIDEVEDFTEEVEPQEVPGISTAAQIVE